MWALKGIMHDRRETISLIFDSVMLLVGLAGWALAIILMLDLFWL